MITCISSGSNFQNETINTLRFAQKAKKVVNKPVINLDIKSKIILELKQQIHELNIKLNAKNQDILIQNSVPCAFNQIEKYECLTPFMLSKLDEFCNEYKLNYGNSNAS